MAILYDSATGRYLEVSPQDLRQLALQNPSLNAQAVASVNGARIGVRGTITPNLLVLPKTNVVRVWVGYGVWSGGIDGWQKVTATAGTPIGITTGVTGWGTTQIKLSVNLGAGKYKVGETYYVHDEDIETKAVNPSGGGGGSLLFPIKYGTTNNSAVMQFQAWLKGCGHFVSSFNPNGNWGDATQAGAQKEGISVINSQAELDEIVKRPCRSAGGGGGSNPPSGGGGTVDPNPLPAVPPAPTDNTWLYGGLLLLGAVAIKNMGGKKKKKKKNR